MNIGIIGYGSMGKMLADRFASAGYKVFVSTRTRSRLESVPSSVTVSDSNADAASSSDIIFVCVRPVDMKEVILEIDPAVREDALIVSLNGSISFDSLASWTSRKTAKVIPSVTAHIDRSQTLVCFSGKVSSADKEPLNDLLKVIGNVIELPENEMGMGSELVSCMPGFIASVFDVICDRAKPHTSIPDDQIVKMVLDTLSATADLMIKDEMTFSEVVGRVATKGGITEEGTRVIYDKFPEVMDELYAVTMEKRRKTAEANREEK